MKHVAMVVMVGEVGEVNERVSYNKIVIIKMHKMF